MLIENNLQTFLIISICIFVSVNANLKYGRFDKAQGQISMKKPTGGQTGLASNYPISVQAKSKIDCCSKCLNSATCTCFSFDKQLQICEMGGCAADNSTTILSEQFYLTCDGGDGFRRMTYGTITACVWMSTTHVPYSTARDACMAKASHLFTLKVADKLMMLRNHFGIFVTTAYWIGLNDLETEGIYRWVDDNSVCGAPLVSTLFIPYQPDNYNNQDCITYFTGGLDDDYCNNSYNYICEKPFFNIV